MNVKNGIALLGSRDCECFAIKYACNTFVSVYIIREYRIRKQTLFQDRFKETK